MKNEDWANLIEDAEIIEKEIVYVKETNSYIEISFGDILREITLYKDGTWAYM